MLELVGIGAVAGLVGSALGVGGGVILVPGFILLAGLAPRAAVGTSLACVVATATAATIAHLRRGTIQFGDGADLAGFGALGSVAAGILAARVGPGVIVAAFAVLLLFTAVGMWPWAPDRPDVPRAQRRSAVRAAVAGGGAVAGLFGVGGGIIFVPVLHLWGGRPFQRSTALSLVIIVATAAAGVVVYIARGDVAAGTALPAMAGTVVGAMIGVPLSARLGSRWLKGGFSLLLIYIAVAMLRESIG
ncbi:MAG: sulfite exporter TauE/SafE family protein [Gemmatimonadales bacterium]